MGVSAGSFGIVDGAILVCSGQKVSRQADVDQHPIESNSSASPFCDLLQETIVQLNGGNVQTAADVEGASRAQKVSRDALNGAEKII